VFLSNLFKRDFLGDGFCLRNRGLAYARKNGISWLVGWKEEKGEAKFGSRKRGDTSRSQLFF